MKQATTIFFLFALVVGGVAQASGKTKTSHEKVAYQLLDLLDIERTVMAGVSTMSDVMVQQSPELEPFQDLITDWAVGFMTWENMSPRFVDIYTGAFTEKELKDLIGFYKTPTGKKSLAVMPQLMQEGAQVGTSLATENSPVLEKMIEERMAEMNAEQEPK